MILVLCGSIAAGCAIITLAYGAEKILERAIKPPRRRKRAARPGAEVAFVRPPSLTRGPSSAAEVGAGRLGPWKISGRSS